MKHLRIAGMTVLASALAANMNPLHAQETNEPASATPQRGEVEQLKRQLQQMQANFEKREAEEKAEIDALKKQVEALSEKQAGVANMPVAAAPPETNAV